MRNSSGGLRRAISRRRCLATLATVSGIAALGACGGPTAPVSRTTGSAAATSATASGVAARAPTPSATTAAAATPGTSASAPPGAATTTLTFVHWQVTPQEQQHTVDDPVKQFEQANPKTHVDVVIAPTGPAFIEKVLAMIAGNVTPDVMGLGGPAAGLPTLASKGILADLGPLISRDSKEVQPDDFVPGALSVGQWQGKQYGIVTTLSAAALVYNADALQKAGITQTPAQLYDAGKWTWDALTAMAQQATVRPSGSAPPSQYGFLVPFDIQYGMSFVWEAGGDLLDKTLTKCLLDTPGSIAGLQYLDDLRNKFQVSPTTKEAAAYAFKSGNLCMAINWAHQVGINYGAAQFSWDIAPLPTGKGGEIVNDNFNNIALARSSKHEETSWAFLQLMVSPAVYLGRQHTIPPPRTSVYQDWLKWMQQSPRPKNLQYLPVLIAHSRSLPYLPVWQQINVAWPKATASLADGSKTPGDVAKALTAQIDGILQQPAP